MNSVPHIFKERLIQNYLVKFTRDNIPNFDDKWNIIRRWKTACERSDLDRTKETQIQGTFMVQVFDEVLGYTTVTSTDNDCYNQKQEFTSALDASEADGGLGFFSEARKLRDVRVVVELKDAKKDLDKKQNRSSHLTPVEQGFSYANKNGSKCGWVIVSNFIETRLYRSTSSLEYETFDIRKMDDENEFLRFYFLLCKDHLITETGKSFVDGLYQENEEMGVAISNDFYKTYKQLRMDLYSNLKALNDGKDELLLFTKSQKIMDRFTFICFCEDCGLLPQRTFENLIESAQHSFSMSPTKIWDELRGLFRAIDQGNPPMKINRYNGGLFREDAELDNLMIGNDVLTAFTTLSAYDFGSDLNVNILGQIFEQSISDVEQIKNEISGLSSDSKGKQKEDGIFYTPYYVTRYIVEQTVGAYLAGKKEELKQAIFQNGPFEVKVLKSSTNRHRTIAFTAWEDLPAETSEMTEDQSLHREAVQQLHLHYWTEYEEILKNIKICDPACGSGAFLNQCFDFLHEEMNFVLEMKYNLNGEQFNLFDIDKQILQNNLFGVDINPESVEITKLSLWLKTAKQNQTLASLDDNIKCGNSIVADSDVAGELAFNWQEEFPDIFARGGFDIIVGNPPYGAEVSQEVKDYATRNYATVEGNFDTYKVFFELGFMLLKQGGYLGYITPNTYFDLRRSGTKLRQLLFSHTLLKIVELYNVFPNAVVEPVISVYQKENNGQADLEIILIPRNTHLSSTFIADGVHYIRPQSDLRKDPDYIFNYKINNDVQNIIEAIRAISRPLSQCYFVYNGAKPYEVGKGTPPQTKEMTKQKVYNGYTKIDDTWIPYMRGKRIQRFTSMWDGEYIKYGENLAAPRSESVFKREKIFVRQTGDSIIATLDKNNVANNTLHVIFSRDLSELSDVYLLGILNSTLMTWIYQSEHPLEVGKPMAEVKKAFVEKLPLAIGNPEQIGKTEEIVKYLLALCQKRFDQKQTFLNFITKAYEPKKISDQMWDFDKCSFRDFVAELKTQKVKLTSAQQMDLLELYEKQKQDVADMTAQIDAAQRQLDDLVFEIYQIPTDVAQSIRERIQITL